MPVGLRLITAVLLLSCCLLLTAEERDSVSQYGITWTFDKAYPCGQFITGDWWVVGPVSVVSISPEPGAAQTDNTKVKKNKFGDHAIKPDSRMRNGSVIIEERTGKQGFDSRLINYDPDLSKTFPLKLKPDQSLISSVSWDVVDPKQYICHQIMWSSEKKARVVLKTAAVLTCLDVAPPEDAFRPASVGTQKRIFRESDIQWDKLGSLKPTAGAPDWKMLERWFERPWIDNTGGWILQRTGPTENNPVYGREFSRMTGLAALALMTDAGREQKRKTLIGLIQYGIDVQGFIDHGLNWMADGGHYSGRKLPLMFAGILLDDETMMNPKPEVRFQEDQDTYYGKGWAGQTALWQMVTHHGPRRSYEHIHPSKWDKMDKRSEGYRKCCNGRAWIGTALTMRLFEDGVKIWNHDAFFDYCDRWMEEKDPYAENRGTFKRPGSEGSAFEGFVTKMWRQYRDTTNDQEYAGNPRKWQWTMEKGQAKGPGKWIDNPKPE